MKTVERIPARAEIPGSRIEGGERIGVSPETFAAYMKQITSIYPGVRQVDVFVSEWEPPQGKVPHTVSTLVAARDHDGRRELRITAIHPDRLSEEDLQWMFGQVLPSEMRVPATSSLVRESKEGFARRLQSWEALEDMLEARRRLMVTRLYDARMSDEGMRALCKKVLDTYPDEEIIPLLEEHQDEPTRAAFDVIALIPHVLERGDVEMKRLALAIDHLATIWERQDDRTRSRIRRALDASIMSRADRETIP